MFGDFFLKIKDLASLGLSNIAQNGIMALFWFVLVTIVSKDEYGEVTYLISIAVFATGAYQLGLHNLIVVYGAKKENVFYPAYLVGMISSIGASLIVYLLTQNLFISFLVWGTMLFDLMLANLRSKTRFQAFSIYSVLRRTFSLILSLLLYTILGVDGIILGFSIATLLGVIGMYHFFKSQKNGFAVLKSKLGFIINNSIIGLLITFNDSGIKLFIGNLFGFSTLAGFQIAFQYSIMLGLVPMVLSIYLLPKEAKGIKNKKLN